MPQLELSCRLSWLLPHARGADCDSAPEHHEWGQQRRNISAVLTKNQPADSSPEHGRRGGSLALQTSLLLPLKYCSQHLGELIPLLKIFCRVCLSPWPAVCSGLCFSPLRLLPLWTSSCESSVMYMLTGVKFIT